MIKRHKYSNLIRMVVDTILFFVGLTALVCFLCFLLIDKEVNLVSIIILSSSVLLELIMLLIVCILNKYGKNSICFMNDKMIYQQIAFTIEQVSIRYFKFQVSILEPNLVIPKAKINIDNSSFVCYLSKCDIKRLEKMGYEIKRI